MVLQHVLAFSIAPSPTCVKPDGKPYIRSIKGGKQNSKEEDRDYYVSTDPVHAALGKFLITKVGEISVFDFTEEVY
ncbi:hypothetical protein BD626DRAFT_549388 [Schizophyllum amplum]|uniref:Stress-response A/B barrel domain-containing protein n=1 Tax=Schizophyllum amplum TaxID=97359 RepID=A0A550C8S7_9AGAR|nr:hypothetical protein BD626DRAFT_549388 [Auriculariopsis ampla]